MEKYKEDYSRDGIVKNYQIATIVDTPNGRQAHFMDREVQNMPILDELNLESGSRYNKFDMTFWTVDQAQTGRSIPPETEFILPNN